MNRQIVKLFSLIAVLFAVLVGFTSYWSVFDAKALKEESVNKFPLLEQQQIRRGRILAADGAVIAGSVARGHGAGLRYVRRYPQGSLFGHPIGYSYVREGDSEFEQSHNEELVGNGSEFSSILDELSGRAKRGDDLVTNLDPAAQRVALQGLEAAGFGAVVAIEPSSGRVRVLASNPPFDPNRVPEHLSALNTDPTSPLLDRATQGQYPPGSTFKVVTAAAGLDGGAITPETTIDAPGAALGPGPAAPERLQPELRPDLARHGADLLGQHLVRAARPAGRRADAVRLHATASASTRPRRSTSPRRRSTRAASSRAKKLLGPGDPVDLARVAIGQERLAVTPLQMAEVAAAVANGGRLMKPQIWSRVVDPDGRVVKRLEPSQYSQPISVPDRGGADHRDGRSGQRRHRHQRGDPRRPGRRQDGNGGNPLQPDPAAAAPTRTRHGS